MFQKGQKPPTKRQAKVEPQIPVAEPMPGIFEVSDSESVNPRGFETPIALAEALVAPGPTVLTNFTHTALGTFQDSVNFRWHLIEIKYSPSTKECVVDKIEEIGDSATRVEAFKIRAVNLNLVP